ncbi:MAG: hypothetical protein ACRD0U_20205 [Acidimicrobiales bacterium]
MTSTSCLVRSGLVRRVAATVCGAHRLLWNHGGAADDLAGPGLVSVLAPASTYLRPLLTVGRDRGVESVLLLRGSGPFARQVIDGARREADAIGLPVSVAGLVSWHGPAPVIGRALLIAGTFEQDLAAGRRLRTAAVRVKLLGCVAAGVREFEARLGPLSDGVLGPAQWVNRGQPVEVGPTGAAFAQRLEARTGRIPDYPAAQAAGTGWLAAEATRRRFGAERGAKVAHHHAARRLCLGFVVATGWVHARRGPMASRSARPALTGILVSGRPTPTDGLCPRSTSWDPRRFGAAGTTSGCPGGQRAGGVVQKACMSWRSWHAARPDRRRRLPAHLARAVPGDKSRANG